MHGFFYYSIAITTASDFPFNCFEWEGCAEESEVGHWHSEGSPEFLRAGWLVLNSDSEVEFHCNSSEFPYSEDTRPAADEPRLQWIISSRAFALVSMFLWDQSHTSHKPRF